MRGRDEQEGLRRTLHRVLVPPSRPNPAVLLWRWRYEVGLPLVSGWLVWRAGPVVVLVTVSVAASLVAAWPGLRRRGWRWLVGRWWCVVTPHRVRAFCAQRGLLTRRGRLPVVLWCRRAVHGERLALWCPAGLEAADFAAERTGLASACLAREVHVQVHHRYPNVIYLAVVRRTRADSADEGAG